MRKRMGVHNAETERIHQLVKRIQEGYRKKKGRWALKCYARPDRQVEVNELVRLLEPRLRGAIFRRHYQFPGWELADFLQEARWQVCRALERWRDNKGTRFTTLVDLRVQCWLMNEWGHQKLPKRAFHLNIDTERYLTDTKSEDTTEERIEMYAEADLKVETLNREKDVRTMLYPFERPVDEVAVGGTLLPGLCEGVKDYLRSKIYGTPPRTKREVQWYRLRYERSWRITSTMAKRAQLGQSLTLAEVAKETKIGALQVRKLMQAYIRPALLEMGVKAEMV